MNIHNLVRWLQERDSLFLRYVAFFPPLHRLKEFLEKGFIDMDLNWSFSQGLTLSESEVKLPEVQLLLVLLNSTINCSFSCFLTNNQQSVLMRFLAECNGAHGSACYRLFLLLETCLKQSCLNRLLLVEGVFIKIEPFVRQPFDVEICFDCLE